MDDFRKIYISYGDKFKDKLSLFLSYGYKATNGYSSAFNVQSLKPTAGIAGWSYTTDNQGNVRYLIGDRGDNRWWDDNIAVKAGYDFSKATKVNLSFVRNRYEYNFTLPLLEKHILTFGGSFRHGWADTKEHNLTNWKDETSKTTLAYQSKGKDRTYAAFFQDEIIILDNLTPYIGFRQDWWEATDGYVNQAGTAGYPKVFSSRGASAFSPKAAIVYMPFEKTSLRTSIGKAFRPPTVYELYRTWRSSRGVTYAGNPDLKPETTTSWDISVEQGLWKGAKIKAAYFENYMKALIYRKKVTDTLQELINAGKAEGKGLEIEVEQKFDIGLRLFGNFTYNNAKIKENAAKPETVGKKLTQVPERLFNIGGDFEKGAFSASLIGRYVSKRYSDDENKDIVNNVYTSYDPYFVTDAKVSYKITKFASVSFSVDNIFDRDYFGYYKAPGRSWFGEVTLRF